MQYEVCEDIDSLIQLYLSDSYLLIGLDRSLIFDCHNQLV